MQQLTRAGVGGPFPLSKEAALLSNWTEISLVADAFWGSASDEDKKSKSISGSIHNKPTNHPPDPMLGGIRSSMRCTLLGHGRNPSSHVSSSRAAPNGPLDAALDHCNLITKPDASPQTPHMESMLKGPSWIIVEFFLCVQGVLSVEAIELSAPLHALSLNKFENRTARVVRMVGIRWDPHQGMRWIGSATTILSSHSGKAHWRVKASLAGAIFLLKGTVVGESVVEIPSHRCWEIPKTSDANVS